MKYIITIPTLLLVVSVAFGQSLDVSSFKEKMSTTIPTINNSTTLLNPVLVDDYVQTIHGNIDMVWRHTNPVFTGLTFPLLYAASDGSFYMQGFSGNGGTFTRIDENGKIVWMIDRYDHKDPTIKFFNSFERFSELSNGNILVYGGEGISSGVVSGYVPMKMILMPSGTILEEKSTRDMINTLGSSGFAIPTYTNIIPEEILFNLGIEFYDTDDKTALKMYSMDLNLQERKKSLRIETGMSEFWSGPEILSYKDNTFILAIEGKSVEHPIYHIAFLQYKNDYTFVKKTIVPTNGYSKFVVADNHSLVIASSITTNNSKPLHLRKIDENGSQLWEKVVDGLKDIPLKVNKLYTTRDGGFIVTGESWLRKSDGSVDYDNETRMGLITKLTAEGEMQWYYTTGRAGLWNRIFCVAEASNGDFITVCNSGNTSSAEESMEIVRLHPKTTGVVEELNNLDGNVTISPNPTNTMFTISGINTASSVKIVNNIGMEVISTSSLGSSNQQVDVSNLPSGVYFVQIRTSTGMISKPIVISR